MPTKPHSEPHDSQSRVLHALRLDGVKLPSANKLIRSHWVDVNFRRKCELALDPLTASKRANVVKTIFRKRGKPYRKTTPKPRAHRCRITVTRILGPRERAYEGENAWASMKPVIDALVLAGYLPADTDEWLTRMPPVTRKPMNGERGPAVLVTIEAAP